ncbi:hypothetical protein Taro_006958 [Colocasia esculenta]|uniref:3-oxo-5-alpha-steroid 4-dehydrogenase C-terminal domain-containing protein n=1 Tax=Colocasia esculenta TaxID=4460 RepID=A0A843TSU3_COLES|nr:hypothetical protein [Colocasia esculenta]
MSSFLISTLVFPPSPSLLAVNAMAVISLVGLSLIGASEAVGSGHLQYSKFANAAASPGKLLLLGLGGGRRVSSRVGMVVLYAPALAAALAAFAFPGMAETPRGSLFLHRYSGYMIVDSMIVISFSYFMNTVFVIYAQYLSRGVPEPAIDLKYAGIVLFLVGISGNLYHHVLLSKLRKKDEKGYKIPKGGFFALVICPHYLFEIIGLLGISFISPTLNSFAFGLGSAVYLVGRSYSTRKWYCSKFDNFPREIKALVPYVF